MEDRTVPATLFVDDSLVDGTALASLPSSIQVTDDRDSSNTLSTGDQVSIAVGETGTTANLTYNEAPVSGDTGSAYSTITAAINAAAPGDTIEIAKGTYPESLNLTQQLTLDGLTNVASDVVINPSSGAGITISANGVVIRDLTVSAAAGTGIVVPSSATAVASLTLDDVTVNTTASTANAGIDLTGNGSAGSILTLNGVTVNVGTSGTGAALTASGFERVDLTDLVVPMVGTAAGSMITLPSGSTSATINAAVTGNTAATITASATSLQLGAADAAITLANVDNLNLTGTSAADTFAVTPSPTGGSIITVAGGAPLGGTTGDTLNLNLAGLTGTAVNNLAVGVNGLSGAFTFSNAANVVFSGIESLANAAVISGTVFNDVNGNGMQDSGEQGIDDVVVQLDEGANGTVDQSAPTDAQGHYAFAVLTAGTERVRIVVPSGDTQTTSNPADINATLGGTTANVDFGVQGAVAAGTSTVTGIVFSDVNKNGKMDTGEVGVNGLTVYLDLNGNNKLDNNEPSTLSSRLNGVNGSFVLNTTDVGATAAVRVVEKPGFLINTTSTSVMLADGQTENVNVGVSTKLPPQATPARLFAVGIVEGNANHVKVFDGDGDEVFTITIPGSFPGGLRAAVGDVTGDGVEDVVVTTGPGGPVQLMVFDGATHQEIFHASPFESTFTGGAFVALGDITGDGIDDIVVSPDMGGGPRIVVYRGGDFQQIMSFLGIDDDNFRGGARAGFGDMDGDGIEDLIVSAGFLGGPRVSILDGAMLNRGQFHHLINDFFAFEQTLRNGTFVSAGDVDGDGIADLVIGAGPGGGPRVLVLSGATLLNQGAVAALQNPLLNFFAGNSSNRGGVHVAVKDLDGDGLADIITGDGAGDNVTGFHGKNGSQKFHLSEHDDHSDSHGVFVG